MEGFTLVELMVAITITIVLLAMVPFVIQAVSDSAAYSQGTAAASTQARTAFQEMQNRVQSASQVCLPTQMTTVGPTVTAGFGLRIMTYAFGKSQWDQWIVNTSTHTLQEQEWPSNWVNGNAVPAWNTVATGVVNSSTVPFSLPTVSTGSPQTLAADLQLQTSYGHTKQSAEFKATMAALDTPYTSNPTVVCATASTQEGWT